MQGGFDGLWQFHKVACVGMLATQLNEAVANNQITKEAVIRLKNFVVNEVQQKK